MKKSIFTLLCLMGVCQLGVAREVRTLETEIPQVPEGETVATYPVPRTDWVAGVRWQIEAGKKAAANTSVILDGDSITAGWRRHWKTLFPDVPAFNFAIGGDRTQHLLWRLQQGQGEGMKPEVIFLMIGTNNLGHNESEKDVIEGVRATVEAYRQLFPEAVIYLQAILPRGRGSYLEDSNDSYAKKIKAVNSEIVKLADGKQVIWLDLSHVFLKEDGTIDNTLMPDLLHPSKEGYAAWAEVIKPLMPTAPVPVQE
jgi:lysophospholipase L1-like esterase